MIAASIATFEIIVGSVAGAAVILVCIFLWIFMRRADVRNEFIARLVKSRPEIQPLGVEGEWLLLRLPKIEEPVRFNLQNLADRVHHSRSRGYRQRLEVYDKSIRTLDETAASHEPMRIEIHGNRILPRLVPTEFPRSFLQAAGKNPLVHRPAVGLPGLLIAYVLDAEASVRFLLRGDAQRLELTDEALDELAMTNLRARFKFDPVREQIDKGGIVDIRTGDSFDAARILCVPENLRIGEAVCVLISDRDSMLIMPMPAAGTDRERVAALAKSLHGSAYYPLLNFPIKVTRGGFEPL